MPAATASATQSSHPRPRHPCPPAAANRAAAESEESFELFSAARLVVSLFFFDTDSTAKSALRSEPAFGLLDTAVEFRPATPSICTRNRHRQSRIRLSHRLLIAALGDVTTTHFTGPTDPATSQRLRICPFEPVFAAREKSDWDRDDHRCVGEIEVLTGRLFRTLSRVRRVPSHHRRCCS